MSRIWTIIRKRCGLNIFTKKIKSFYSSYPFNLHQQFFLVKIWSNWETKVSFRFSSSRRFQNTPWKSKLTKIWWSNGLLQKPSLLIVEEKFYEQNVVGSISHSIFDQIKFPGGVLESSWQANSETILWNSISSRFDGENKGTCWCKVNGLLLYYQQQICV